MTHEDKKIDSQKNDFPVDPEWDDDDDNDDFDADRYDSAAGWEPADKDAKMRAAYRKKHPVIQPGDNLLTVKPANEWIEDGEFESVSAKLFGDLWKEGELSILFADTGVGKSILAVQIAETIARGVRTDAETQRHSDAGNEIDAATPRHRDAEIRVSASPRLNFSASSSFPLPASPRPTVSASSSLGPLEMTAGGQKVLYLDFELSTGQFTERYSRTSPGGKPDRYRFSPRLLRTEIKWDDDIPEAFKTLGDFMGYSVAARIRESDAKILIVDNISWLNTSNVGANAALRLMKALKTIKTDFEISILVLAHTPKRTLARPLTVNDLAGSKMLANFADNMFAIGASVQTSDLRYIKHIKQRNCAAVYDASNVIVCRLQKPHNFPMFTFVEFSNERTHTTRPYDNTNADRQKLIAAAIELSAKGHTQRDIAEMLGVGLATVNRYLSE